MSGARCQLTADIASLRHMLETRKEQVQLLRALQSLEAELHDLTPSLQQRPQVSVKTKKDQKKKVLAFLLSLRSGKIPCPQKLTWRKARERVKKRERQMAGFSLTRRRSWTPLQHLRLDLMVPCLAVVVNR